MQSTRDQMPKKPEESSPTRDTIKQFDNKKEWSEYNLNGVVTLRQGSIDARNNRTYAYFRGGDKTVYTVKTNNRKKKAIITKFFNDNFDDVKVQRENFFNNECNTILQFGAGVGNYLTIKLNENPNFTTCIAYEFDKFAFKQLETNKAITTRQIDLNACSDGKNLDYSKTLSEDLANPANILAINIIEYLDGIAIKLLLFQLINEAKPGTTIYFYNHVIDQNGVYKWYSNGREILGINTLTSGMQEWVEDLGGYKELPPNKSDHTPGPLTNNMLRRKYSNGMLPKFWLASFFAPREDWKIKDLEARASDGDGLIVYDESFIVEKMKFTDENDSLIQKAKELFGNKEDHKTVLESIINKSYGQALRRASEKGLLAPVEFLLKHKKQLNLDINETSSNGKSALAWLGVSPEGDKLKIQELLLENGAKGDERENEKQEMRPGKNK